MEAYVEKRKQPQHSPEANQLRQVQDFPKRRDRKCDDKKSQRPIAGSVRDEGYRIGGEIVVETAPDEHRDRHKASHKHNNFGPLAGED